LWGTNGCPTPQHRKTGFQYINYLRARLLCSFVLPHSLSLSVSLFLPSSCCCFWIASLCVPQQQQPRAYGDTAIAPLFLRDGAASEGSDTHGTQLLVCVYGQRMAAWPCLRLLCNVLYTRTHERETNIGHEFHPVTLVCRRPARRISGSGEIGTHAVGGSREQERERERERVETDPAVPSIASSSNRGDRTVSRRSDSQTYGRPVACMRARKTPGSSAPIHTHRPWGRGCDARHAGRATTRAPKRALQAALSLSLSFYISLLHHVTGMPTMAASAPRFEARGAAARRCGSGREGMGDSHAVMEGCA
jgi:hypothetical protein